MSASVKIILHTKKYSDGTQPVMLQCIVTGSSKTVWKRRTLCKVKPAQFDKKAGRVIKHPNLLVLNAHIVDAFNQAEAKLHQALREGRPIDPAQIIATGVATVNKAAYLLAHGQAYIERCRQKEQFHTADKYGSHLTRLAEYLGNDSAGEQIDVHLDDIDEAWILAFSVWLKDHGTKSANTLHRRMAFVTTLFRDARRRGLTQADPMAFLEFKEQRVRKPKLTPEQLSTLEALELEGRENDARNTFLLQFFAYGSRISDALSWQKSDVRQESGVWYLSYTSMKTGDLIDVRLNPKAQALIERYLASVPGKFLLPWLAGYEPVPGWSERQNREQLIKQIESKTQLVNVELKKVAKKAGFTLNLSTHIARHTFASIADSRIADKRKLSAALGHSKFSTTEGYLAQLRHSDVNDAMEEVWK
jgi:site-specific recombinase XerD